MTRRNVIALMILPWLIVIILFQPLADLAASLGLLDHQARDRMQVAARDSLSEWKSEWLGIKTLQYPEDLLVYQDLVNRVKPDVIIETGTFTGGLTLYLATLLEAVRPDARIVTIDIEDSYWQDTLKQLDAAGKDQLLERITFIKGSSTAPDTLQAVEKHVPEGARVLVILDSLHSREHVLSELKAYGPLVSKDSFLIVNDTQWDGQTLDGVLYGAGLAVDDFLAGNDQFVQDRSVERYKISCAHGGFLRRVK